MKLEEISNAVIDKLNATCTECGITNDIIDEQSFFCNPESLTYVTYTARLEGTSETDSGSLISLIEVWVSKESSIVMAGVELAVNSECSVAISTLTDKDCFPTIETTMTTTDNTISAITGGVVAVVFIIALTIATVAMAVALIVRSRAKMSINYNEE